MQSSTLYPSAPRLNDQAFGEVSVVSEVSVYVYV
jgi:hypothetical protein